MIHVALATDESYLPWAGTLIRSILDCQHGEAVSFHVVHAVKLPTVGTDQLAQAVSEHGSALHLHLVDDQRVHALPTVHRFGEVVWLRFLLPELLPTIPRVLFLDADTFVVHSLDPLWSTSLEEAPLAGVPNVVQPALREHVRSLGLADPRRFMNSGVVLMDLNAMRREPLMDDLARFVSECGDRLVWPDQDALNVLFKDRWIALHPRWNAMNSLWTWPEWAEEVYGEEQSRSARSAPSILHFEGPAFCKPWHYLSTHPWRESYRNTLKRTAWSHTPLTERTPATMLIRLLPKRLRVPAYLTVRGARTVK